MKYIFAVLELPTLIIIKRLEDSCNYSNHSAFPLIVWNKQVFSKCLNWSVLYSILLF